MYLVYAIVQYHLTCCTVYMLLYSIYAVVQYICCCTVYAVVQYVTCCTGRTNKMKQNYN